jgi:hypothetical protein
MHFYICYIRSLGSGGNTGIGGGADCGGGPGIMLARPMFGLYVGLGLAAVEEGTGGIGAVGGSCLGGTPGVPWDDGIGACCGGKTMGSFSRLGRLDIL